LGPFKKLTFLGPDPLTASRRVARTNPEVRWNEQTNDTERRRRAQTQLDTHEQEAMNARARRLNTTHEMACRYIPVTGCEEEEYLR
jgi:hypothetical protein